MTHGIQHDSDAGIRPPLVCTFESRRSDEMCSLIRRHGGEPLAAPSMREVPIADNPGAIRFIQDAIQDRFPVIILLTGVGTQALFDVAQSQNLLIPLQHAFRRATVVIRGPKPAAVLRQLDLHYDLRADEPNTWRELLASMEQAAARDSRFRLDGRQVAVQEYGVPNPRLTSTLTERGAVVTSVPVYRWALPENLEPLQDAIRRTSAGEIEILLFTSANQATSVLQVAAEMPQSEAFRTASQRTLTASIGPACTETLMENGWPVSYEASPSRMAVLVRGALELWNHRRISS